MLFIGVDLGTTNIKAAAYDEQFCLLGRESAPVTYVRSGPVVEFDAEAYYDALLELLNRLLDRPAVGRSQVAQLVFTGQAESLVVLDQAGKALMRAISWMDERSEAECALLAAQFDPQLCESVTGQQAVLPTWPATKVLWLKRHAPEIYDAAARYLLLKDYIVYRLTGVMEADMSIATFSFWFDIYEKCYWSGMLEALGLRQDQLAPLTEPCTVAGTLTVEAAQALGLTQTVRVNHGTLDHFTGMIGTGNTKPGGVSLSTGTVMALAAMAKSPVTDRCCGVAMHYGFRPDTHVMLPVAESGGVSLEWFRKTCMGDVNYDELNRVLADRPRPSPIVFLPYLVGTNAPEFDRRASGVFFGLRAEHDRYDMAAAVMEGVACLLKKNCDDLRAKGAEPDRIIATGGGAKSDLWCQMQADLTGLPVVRPAEMEAACLGAAMIGAVSEGIYPSYDAAAEAAVSFDRRFLPEKTNEYTQTYRRFCALYEATVQIAEL